MGKVGAGGQQSRGAESWPSPGRQQSDPATAITQATWSRLWASVPSFSRLSTRLSPLLARVALRAAATLTLPPRTETEGK